ncbi:MAG: ATP-dependent protease ATPase subunit HslU [Spirochaetaceae bacterium]|nr:ATP-dependent protease ATPase subunit HslU [Spirochaetaceae bacterium]
MTKKMRSLDLTPREIVEKLDAYIIGQHKAKKAVAIALRNRARRLKLDEDIRDEIVPKNILMIGPTGVGKTEIARRLAKLCDAPFLKVEATKYTEVGYVGRDVESMVRDLAAVAANMVRSEMQDKFKNTAEARVENELLDLLLPGGRKKKETRQRGEKVIALPMELSGREIKPQDMEKALEMVFSGEFVGKKHNIIEEKSEIVVEKPEAEAGKLSTREKLREKLKNGELEDRIVEVNVQRARTNFPVEILAGGSFEDLEAGMQNLTSLFTGGGRQRKKSVTLGEARRILMEDQLDRLIDTDKVAEEARLRVQQMGIIFIDEIDKIAVRGEASGQDVSREGVQRDILPIVEGSNVNSKYGVIDTTHILFIAAGAFNLSKPSDLIPELQGRFPLRVELDSLNTEDFKRILREPKNAITKQYTELLATEKVTLKFSDAAIDRMSFLAADVNARAENIGARRLHTIIETVLEEISFEADAHGGETLEITAEYVDERLKSIVEDQDLSRYIL